MDLPSAEQEGAELVAAIRAAGRKAAFVAVDVTDYESVRAAFERANRALGTGTVLVNNAGIAVRVPALDLEPADWSRVLAVNLTGAFYCAQQFARGLIAAEKAGAIVNVASIFGLVAGPNRAAYSSSKAGLVNLTRVLAYEWDRYGIRVNAVAPTFVRTPLTERLLAEGLDVQNLAFGEKLATTADVAEAIFFLAGASAAMVNGHTLPVDGGWTSY
ncbi:MAG: SDR family oxidoreductase [Candidatus Eremiobacteraeota bacterium]|nr:SDR family oxidoreductase [Candidatus Eremiobacteraeota bacterium]